MTVVITHNFVSAKSDGADSTLVQPSNWGNAATNAAGSTHTITGLGTAAGLNTGTSGNAIPVLNAVGNTWANAQTFTAAPVFSDQVNTRVACYAAPFDALAYNGIQINGSMEVSQEKGTTPTTTLGQYVCDGWRVNGVSSTYTFSVSQVTDAPPGYNNSIKFTFPVAENPLQNTSILNINHPIEYYRMSRLGFGAANPQFIAIGFWTKIHRTGTYSGAIRNYAASRSYPFTFTQNFADTWEFKTVTISGDSTAAWVVTANTEAMTLYISVAAGSNFTQAAGAWYGGSALAATGTVNNILTSDTFQITGVVVLPGIELPSSTRAPLIMRPFDQEVLACRRYWEKSYDYASPPGSVTFNGASGFRAPYANSSGTVEFSIIYTVPKRTNAPTISIYSTAGSLGYIRNNSSSTDLAATVHTKGETGFLVYPTGTNAISDLLVAHYVSDARL